MHMRIELAKSLFLTLGSKPSVLRPLIDHTIYGIDHRVNTMLFKGTRCMDLYRVTAKGGWEQPQCLFVLACGFTGKRTVAAIVLVDHK